MFSDNKIIRYINQNRRKIIAIIIAIIFMLSIINKLNDKVKRENMIQKEETEQKENSSNKNIDNEKGNINISEKPIMGGETTINKEYVKDVSMVNKFIEACNKKDYQIGYDMLSFDCKEVLYPTIEDFKEKYVDINFVQEREVYMQTWLKKSDFIIYRVKFREDLMNLGEYNQSGDFQDFITIINEDGIEKISTNSFIRREKFQDKKEEKSGILIEIKEIDTYIYRKDIVMSVLNKTDNTIMIAPKKNKSNNIFATLVDGKKRGLKPGSINERELTYKPRQRKLLRLTFDHNFSSDENLEYINFEKIVMNKDKYFDEDLIEDENKYISMKIMV